MKLTYPANCNAFHLKSAKELLQKPSLCVFHPDLPASAMVGPTPELPTDTAIPTVPLLSRSQAKQPSTSNQPSTSHQATNSPINQLNNQPTNKA